MGTDKTNLVALVDDESLVLSAVSRLLRSHSYDCLAYNSAESALADPRFFLTKCMILDIQLPGIDGFSLRDKIRDAGSGIPAYSSPHTLTLGRPNGIAAGGTLPIC